MSDKPKRIAPRAPVVKAGDDKPDDKADADKAAAPKKDERVPTRADFMQLQREIGALRDKVSVQRKSESQLRANLLRVENESALLRAGMDPRWSDVAVLQAFDGVAVDDGPLGAVLALLERQVRLCYEDAESADQRGDRAAVPGFVQAASRIKAARDQVIKLHERANFGDDMEPGMRASRFVD